MRVGVVASVQLQGRGRFPPEEGLNHRVRIFGGPLRGDSRPKLGGKADAKTMPRFEGGASGVVQAESVAQRGIHVGGDERKPRRIGEEGRVRTVKRVGSLFQAQQERARQLGF